MPWMRTLGGHRMLRPQSRILMIFHISFVLSCPYPLCCRDTSLFLSMQSYEPGEQKRRDYTWSIDPSNYRFGQKGGNIPYNGVSSGTPCGRFSMPIAPSHFRSWWACWVSGVAVATCRQGLHPFSSHSRPTDPYLSCPCIVYISFLVYQLWRGFCTVSPRPPSGPSPPSRRSTTRPPWTASVRPLASSFGNVSVEPISIQMRASTG